MMIDETIIFTPIQLDKQSFRFALCLQVKSVNAISTMAINLWSVQGAIKMTTLKRETRHLNHPRLITRLRFDILFTILFRLISKTYHYRIFDYSQL